MKANDPQKIQMSTGMLKARKMYFNLTPSELIEHALHNGEGQLTSTGALMCDTGRFTGRSPQDRFIVKDDCSNSVHWSEINQPFDPQKFEQLLTKMICFAETQTLYVRDMYAGAQEAYRLKVRVINTKAWHNLFCYNLFIRPTEEDLKRFEPDYTIINLPEFEADPVQDGTRSSNFVVISFTKKMILIGGTAYAGEMKKGIFSVLNYLLPKAHQVLPMHCSANVGNTGDTALFFGLSGTGKTALSADTSRKLVGDDEHGWTDEGIFNFEGGCYAKVVNLSQDKEPQIYKAIRFGSIVENTRFRRDSREIDYTNTSVTENTRCAYPLHFIENAIIPSVAHLPKNIFFLSCDAYGVLPPICRLNTSQAMYHFLSGYTAKIAGTETGIDEPKAVFSACFGAPFLPLHPTEYTRMFGQKIKQHQVHVWLVNTGWTGGPYGDGNRISLQYTRALIRAALDGKLEQTSYERDDLFGFEIPQNCPEVPSHILHPRRCWKDQNKYDSQAHALALRFNENFKRYTSFADEEMLQGAPDIEVNA